MKKFLTVLFAICLICGCFAACTLDEEPTTEATPEATALPATQEPEVTPVPIVDVEYDRTKFVLDGLVLKAYIGNDKEVTIPEKIIAIGANAFKDCTTVETINFVDTITEIGDYAFSGCTSLKEIKLPKLVSKVGKKAIAGCTALTYAEMPTNALDLGDGIFSGDTALESAKLSSSLVNIPAGLFENCPKLKEINALAALTTIGDNAFNGCSSLTAINANAVQTVGNFAFKDAAAFENADFSSKIKSVGTEAFEGTKWLAEAKAKADKAVTDYAELAKAGEVDSKQKADLETQSFVIIGNGVLVYWSCLTFDGESDTTIKLINKVKVIGSEAFKSLADKIEMIEIPNSVSAVSANAFADFTKLTSAKIGMSVLEIPEGLFKNCANLKNVIIEGKVTSIGNDAFAGCALLESIALKAEEEKKEDKKAEAAEKEEPAKEEAPKEEVVLKMITLPKSLLSIGDRAFYGCKLIEALTADGELLTIGEEAFFGCEALAKAENIKISETVNKIGAKAFDKTAWFENEQDDIIVGDGVLLKTKDIKAAEANVKSISITVDSLKADEFYDNKKVYSIVVAEGVTEIPARAFYYAENLVSVELPSTITKIGASAFYGCKNLKEIKLGDKITEIGDYAFYGCTSLKEIELPAAVTKIGKYAFYNALNIETITVPAGVSEIGEYAFTNTAWFNNSTEKYLVLGKNILVKYYAFEDETIVNANDGFNKICGGAFEDAPRLQKITLSSNVNELGDFAFSAATALKEINATGVTKVGARAFNSCRALEKAAFAGGASIAEDAFNGCENYNK